MFDNVQAMENLEGFAVLKSGLVSGKYHPCTERGIVEELNGLK